MKQFRFAISAVLCSAIVPAIIIPAIMTVPSHAATFKEINYPNSNSTSANGINDSNEIVGFYQDVNNIIHAYTYINGTFTTIDPPGSSYALAAGINDSRVIVGSYSTTGSAMGFIDTGGKIKNIVYPNSKQQGTQCWGINNNGVIVGTYMLRNSQNQTLSYGFIYENGKFQTLKVPGSSQTLPNGINDAGVVVGTYVNSNGTTNGFSYQNGKYTMVSYPGSAGASSATDMNDTGVLVGGYVKNSIGHGFELIKGKDTTIDYPLATTHNTALNAINKNSYIVGNYGSNSSPQTIGFLRTP